MSEPLLQAMVVVPTYNERANLTSLVTYVMNHTTFSVLIVDDDSPDGTGELADELAEVYTGRIGVIHRRPPRGLGLAYGDGMRRALELGAGLICQMDADLSHDASYLPALAAAAAHADVVVGSRYVRGARVKNWPVHRLLLSAVGNAYVRLVTRLPVRDVTSGFKCWRRQALAAVLDTPLRSEGYAVQFEMLFRAAQQQLRILEVPIVFVERREGASKMSMQVIRESIVRPLQLAFSRPLPVAPHQVRE
jgi:dolichol-phosphate mannosyltransferase